MPVLADNHALYEQRIEKQDMRVTETGEGKPARQCLTSYKRQAYAGKWLLLHFEALKALLRNQRTNFY